MLVMACRWRRRANTLEDPASWTPQHESYSAIPPAQRLATRTVQGGTSAVLDTLPIHMLQPKCMEARR